MKRRKHAWRLIPLLALMVFVLAGCSGALDPSGKTGEDQLFLIKLSFFIMFGVLIVVFALLFYVLIRFAKRKNQKDIIPKQIEGNHKLEIVWTVIPFILLLILAIPTVMLTFQYGKDYTEHKDALTVNVTAHQYWWEFEYPEQGIRTAHDLVIPTDKKIAVALTSSDVIHSFWIPNLTGKMDTNPGMINKMYFDAEEEGVYKGKCAELCGPSHALMDFKVIAMSQDDFNNWVASMTAPDETVTVDSEGGASVFAAKCLSCHAIDSSQRSLGPNLDGFANRETVAGFRPNNEEWLRKWLLDPQEVKPGNEMPNVGLTDEELDQLVEFMKTLK